MIKAFAREHVEAVADLHLRYLTGLLRDLGNHAVRSFYLGAADSELTVARVFESEGRVQGFVLGSVEPGRLRKEIVKSHFIQTVLSTSMGVIRRPKLIHSILISRRDRDSNFDPGAAELIYLAVDKGQRSAGVGKQLVEEFGRELQSSGVVAFELSVDADNVAATAFYERLGFQRIGQYREFGTDHFRFRKTLEVV